MQRSEALRLSEEEIGRVIAIHAEVNGNASAASRALHHAGSTIRKYWRAYGLEPSSSGLNRKLTQN